MKKLTSMRKYLIISGAIGIIVGLIMYIEIELYMMDYTNKLNWMLQSGNDIEALKTLKTWGIILIISGILDFVWIMISDLYTAKILQNPISDEKLTVKCPVCGLPIQNTTPVCPKCKTVINK